MQILILEDNDADVELMKRELRKAGFDFTAQRTQDKGTFVAALEASTPDLILADYSLPGFDGLTALKLARQRWADIPVIIVSGAIGEEVAIETLKTGATDYVLKQRLSRLGPVVHRALAETRERAEKSRAEEALRQSEERFRLLVEGVQDYAILMLDPQGRIASWNAGAERLTGWSGPEVLGQHFALLYTPADRDSGHPQRALEQAAAEGRHEEQGERVRKSGRRFWADVVLTAMRDATGRLHGFAKITRDITERKRAEEALRELNATLESKVAQRTAELEHRARQLQKLTLELSEAEDRERRRLAEILHDDLQQILAAAKFHLSLLGSRAKGDPSQQAIVTEVDQMLMDAIQKSRSLSHELSPAVLYHDDLAETLGWLAGQVQAKHGLAVTRRCLRRSRHASDALKTLPVQGGPGAAVQRGQARPGQRGPHPGPAARAVHLPVGLRSGTRLRPAGTPADRRLWAAEHPRAHRTARRPHEDPQRQGQGQHVSHRGSGRRCRGTRTREPERRGPSGRTRHPTAATACRSLAATGGRPCACCWRTIMRSCGRA